MAGERRMDGYLGSLAIADLAHHDDVGILAEDRAQSVGKGEIDFRTDLHLSDTAELIFDWILDGDDVLFGRVDTAQAGIKRSGLARTGRSGRQDNAMALLDEPVDLAQIVAAKAQSIQIDIDHRLRAVEQAQHDALAKGG